jgi:hypothetical protein
MQTLKKYLRTKIYMYLMAKTGFVYIAYPLSSTRVKIGYSQTSEKQLKARYSTCYGADFKYHLFYHDNPQDLELLVHHTFSQYRITNELFDIAYLEVYKSFLNRYCTSYQENQIETICEKQTEKTINKKTIIIKQQPIVCDPNNERIVSENIDKVNNIWKCKRCGHEFGQKIGLKRHLTKNKICDPKMSDIQACVLLEELNPSYNEVTYDCTMCSKRFNSKSSMYRHKKICKKSSVVTSNQQELDSQQLNACSSHENNIEMRLQALQSTMDKILEIL